MNSRKQVLPFLLLAILLLLLSVAACSSAQSPTATPTLENLDTLPADIQPSDVLPLLNRDDVIILDVREQFEYDEGHIPGVTLVPLGTLPDRLSDIPRDKTIITVCHSGNRSRRAASFLRQQGYEHVHNMLGGMVAWEQQGYKVEK
ncbi:MAG: rhodanese-like domain-containing protein [Chloroflexi bacterium]|nr:rhodanese-like domain-containing protein [Chloroflexota bacterium]